MNNRNVEFPAPRRMHGINKQIEASVKLAENHGVPTLALKFSNSFCKAASRVEVSYVYDHGIYFRFGEQDGFAISHTMTKNAGYTKRTISSEEAETFRKYYPEVCTSFEWDADTGAYRFIPKAEEPKPFEVTRQTDLFDEDEKYGTSELIAATPVPIEQIRDSNVKKIIKEIRENGYVTFNDFKSGRWSEKDYWNFVKKISLGFSYAVLAVPVVTQDGFDVAVTIVDAKEFTRNEEGK